MVFSSLQFCLAFLPCVLLGSLIAQRFGDTAIKVWLIVASLAFYTAWYPPYLVILLGSISANFGLLRFALAQPPDTPERFWTITAGVVGNLCLLGWFKYAGFVTLNINAALNTDLLVPHFLLPLGISFFTFQKIALLIDVYRRDVRHIEFLSYMLFVTFFPQLIAGPIVLFPEVQHQYQEPKRIQLTLRHFALGISIFVVGLFKKTMLADLVSTFASPIFDAAASGTTIRTAEAWTGVLAYTLQIYFDFSGYSDMAIGLAAMFGIVLPFNFASPYRATSIIEFWRRWHITLSRFLRVYLYYPLGGNRHGPTRRYANLILVMLIGGLWHGAAWTFVAWGGLHGIYLVINHFWRSRTWWRPRLNLTVNLALRIAAWSITFLAVIVAWVFFRADTFAAAALLLRQMFDPWGVLEMFLYGLQSDGAYARTAFSQTNSMDPSYITVTILLVLIVCLAAPNTQALFSRALDRWVGPVQEKELPSASTIDWRPSQGWGLTIGLAAASALMAMIVGSSPFLYFNF